MLTLFWICFFLITLHYFIFNILILIISYFIKKEQKTYNIFPRVSFIVAAYNEEKIINEKIKNCFSLDYPKELVEFIIVCDGSTDSTPSIVESYSSKGVICLFDPPRKGKTSALNRAVSKAKNEIIVFSDGNSMFNSDALKRLVSHFNDEKIGGVCGRKNIIKNKSREASRGDSLYWDIESKIKSAESVLGSISSADGEIFALKKNLYPTIPEEIINDDQYITFKLVQSGHKVIYDEMAITSEDASITLKDDFNVKARMIYGSIQLLEQFKSFLNPFKSWFGLQFFIHKTLRYFMWLLLLLIYISNAFVFNKNHFYAFFFSLQTLFYLFSFFGFLSLKFNLKKIKLFYFPYYYCNVNFAAYKGYRFYKNRSNTVSIWKKAER